MTSSVESSHLRLLGIKHPIPETPLVLFAWYTGTSPKRLIRKTFCYVCGGTGVRTRNHLITSSKWCHWTTDTHPVSCPFDEKYIPINKHSNSRLYILGFKLIYNVQSHLFESKSTINPHSKLMHHLNHLNFIYNVGQAVLTTFYYKRNTFKEELKTTISAKENKSQTGYIQKCNLSTGMHKCYLWLHVENCG